MKFLTSMLIPIFACIIGSAQNLIPNGNFDTNIDGWGFSSGSNVNSWDASTQQLKAHIVTPGTSYVSYQFYYYPVASTFSAGESYTLKFDAYGSVRNHSVDVACGYNGSTYLNFISNADRYVSITTTKTTYTIHFTAPSSFAITNFRVGFRIGGSAGNAAQDLFFDNIILTHDLPPPPPETYAIYTNDASIIAGTNVNFVNNKALSISTSTTNTYEGGESKVFNFDKTDTWAMASAQPVGGSVNISGYSGGYFNFAMKASTNRSFFIRIKGGGQIARVSFTQGSDPYGFVRDGNWHFLSIPIADFIANNSALDLKLVTDLFVIRTNEPLALTDNFDIEVDNIFLSLSFPAPPPIILPNAWINEFHYDNPGADVNEFVEVVIKNASLYTLSNFRVDLYNSADGTSYDHLTLDQFTQGVTEGEYTFFTWMPAGGIQDDGGDGIALSYNENLVQFLSYEGTQKATGGAAVGITSTDVGVVEPCINAHVGEVFSIQLVGIGVRYNHFVWIDPPATPGNLNVDNNSNIQVFAFPPSVPLNWKYIFIIFFVIALSTGYNFLRLKRVQKRLQ